eukprot:3935781-Rhodomonas_salina.1
MMMTDDSEVTDCTDLQVSSSFLFTIVISLSGTEKIQATGATNSQSCPRVILSCDDRGTGFILSRVRPGSLLVLWSVESHHQPHSHTDDDDSTSRKGQSLLIINLNGTAVLFNAASEVVADMPQQK